MPDEELAMRWRTPPQTRNAQGEERRLGVELEFLGPSTEEAAHVVQSVFGGEARRTDLYRYDVTGGAVGDFLIKLDMAFVHQKPDGSFLLSEAIDRELRQMVGSVASGVLPMEIVCPPLTLSQAPQLDLLVEALRQAGAHGTSDSIFNAFGAQLNPEAPELSASSVLAHLRAFLALQDWLKDQIRIDVTRRVWSFAAPFPRAYQRRVFAADYAPDLAALTDDYIAANPTRNRALDLLPLLRHLDEARVTQALPTETINARPTYHYRMPNMALEDPDWSIGLEWRRWAVVERLAADEALLGDVAAEWRRIDQNMTESWAPAARMLARCLGATRALAGPGPA